MGEEGIRVTKLGRCHQIHGCWFSLLSWFRKVSTPLFRRWVVGPEYHVDAGVWADGAVCLRGLRETHRLAPMALRDEPHVYDPPIGNTKAG